MNQDYYTLDGQKFDGLIEIYDHKRYTPSKVEKDLKNCYEPSQYKIVKAFKISHSDNYVEFISEDKSKKLQSIKLIIKN